MPRVFPSNTPRQQQGMVLLESLIAILIFSIGILGVVGIQAVMIKNSNDSKYRAIASFVAQQKIGLIWADPDPTRLGYVSPVESDTGISDLLPLGTRTVTTPVVGQFIITITWQQPGSTEEHSFTTTARITGG